MRRGWGGGGVGGREVEVGVCGGGGEWGKVDK